jgi:hypothetical protein
MRDAREEADQSKPVADQSQYEDVTLNVAELDSFLMAHTEGTPSASGTSSPAQQAASSLDDDDDDVFERSINMVFAQDDQSPSPVRQSNAASGTDDDDDDESESIVVRNMDFDDREPAGLPAMSAPDLARRQSIDMDLTEDVTEAMAQAAAEVAAEAASSGGKQQGWNSAMDADERDDTLEALAQLDAANATPSPAPTTAAPADDEVVSRRNSMAMDITELIDEPWEPKEVDPSVVLGFDENMTADIESLIKGRDALARVGAAVEQEPGTTGEDVTMDITDVLGQYADAVAVPRRRGTMPVVRDEPRPQRSTPAPLPPMPSDEALSRRQSVAMDLEDDDVELDDSEMDLDMASARSSIGSAVSLDGHSAILDALLAGQSDSAQDEDTGELLRRGGRAAPTAGTTAAAPAAASSAGNAEEDLMSVVGKLIGADSAAAATAAASPAPTPRHSRKSIAMDLEDSDESEESIVVRPLVPRTTAPAPAPVPSPAPEVDEATGSFDEAESAVLRNLVGDDFSLPLVEESTEEATATATTTTTTTTATMSGSDATTETVAVPPSSAVDSALLGNIIARAREATATGAPLDESLYALATKDLDRLVDSHVDELRLPQLTTPAFVYFPRAPAEPVADAVIRSVAAGLVTRPLFDEIEQLQLSVFHEREAVKAAERDATERALPWIARLREGDEEARQTIVGHAKAAHEAAAQHGWEAVASALRSTTSRVSTTLDEVRARLAEVEAENEKLAAEVDEARAAADTTGGDEAAAEERERAALQEAVGSLAVVNGWQPAVVDDGLFAVDFVHTWLVAAPPVRLAFPFKDRRRRSGRPMFGVPVLSWDEVAASEVDTFDEEIWAYCMRAWKEAVKEAGSCPEVAAVAGSSVSSADRVRAACASVAQRLAAATALCTDAHDAARTYLLTAPTPTNLVLEASGIAGKVAVTFAVDDAGRYPRSVSVAAVDVIFGTVDADEVSSAVADSLADADIHSPNPFVAAATVVSETLSRRTGSGDRDGGDSASSTGRKRRRSSMGGTGRTSRLMSVGGAMTPRTLRMMAEVRRR